MLMPKRVKRRKQFRGTMTGKALRGNKITNCLLYTSKFHRHQGSNGACSDPSKVFKGKRMPGQMGGKKINVQNLEIVKVEDVYKRQV